MEYQVVKPRGRPRGRPPKRRREESQSEEMSDKGNDERKNGNNEGSGGNMSNGRKRGRPPKKRHVEIRGQVFVGRYVMKEFERSGLFVGKIVSYDSGLYRVEYEDGDFEDLDSGELREFLIGKESEVFVGDLLERKKALDERVAKKLGVKLEGELEKAGKGESTSKQDEKDAETVQHDEVKVEVPRSSELYGDEINGNEAFDVDEDDDYDSSSDSGEYGQGWEVRSETEIPAVPPPELPPSSGNIGVPEEYVPHLLSVYGCLRTFSIRLFLSPFTLDDLVGCLNCTVPCTLLDSIHVALLRALRRHLETVASDGSERASKCLRCIDWGLLDMLTWPVYLVHYLMTMGHLHGNEWNGFYMNVLEKNYCTLPVGIKLTVLQILCDDALDNAEIRAEIDTREGAEFGLDSDDFTSLECEPRKDYPRNCKTSAGMDRAVCPVSPNTLVMKINDNNEDTANFDEDRNENECCLCGMDGVLLCCDGCPSAYHSRCIGVSKLSIPDGEWFCPECTFSRIGPPISKGTSLRGAEVFGVDSYAQLFLGTCDHLLVLKVSVKPSSFVRYYSFKDIVKVIQVLCSTPPHATSYMGICEAVSKYFGLPQTVIPPLINSQTTMVFENRDETIVLPAQVQPFGENGSYDVKLENYTTSPGGSFVGNASGSRTEKFSSNVLMETDLTITEGISGASTAQNPPNMISKSVEQAEPSFFGQGLTENFSCISGNKNSNTYGLNNGDLSLKNCSMTRKGDFDAVGRQIDTKRNSTCLYLGTHFKPYAYINNFVHGEYAASAAANFTVLLSEENQASGVHASDPRKAMSANVTLQTKAFMSVAVRFFWPSTEKKLMELPRERCSWCLNCKTSTVTNRKVCLLNSAALNATKAAMKYFSSCKLTKNVESGLYSISIYILYVEESLRGLILGPFMSEAYRLRWRRKVEEASTCSDMKSYLLDLEGNLSTIALSSEWTKLVDNWMDESSVSETACLMTSTQKRGPGRRRKHLTAAGATTSDDSNDKSDICWWRGGKLAKLVFKRASLPSSVLKKAARQGGSRRILGIYYADESVPKRSRQYIWRAATEMARNASELALQVRYLDHHIKWSDLVRPEQTVQEGKGAESDASAFRNAFICEKKVVENKVIYAVAFGNQKHLSTRLMKSIIEKEEGQDGKDKYWFSETRVPLYLIKEYEEKAEKTPLLASREALDAPHKGSLRLSKLQRKQLRAFRRNVFRYLTYKKDNLSMCCCTSCPNDVMIDCAATCNSCEGYCHKTCAMSSTVVTDVNVELVTICKKCSNGKVTQNNGSVESPTTPLALQGLDYQKSTTGTQTTGSKSIRQHQNSATASKSMKPKSRIQQLPTYGTSETPSGKKTSTSDWSMTKSKKAARHWGLIFKKDPTEGGSNFLLNNIICRGDVDNANALHPECVMCKKPYNPQLIYVRCEVCHCWYHADAVELDESKLLNLVGFKCPRCRRMKRPVCPYADPDSKKSGIKKLVIKGPKEESAPATSVSEVMSEQADSLSSTPISTTENDIYIQVDDSLLLSVSEAEPMSEPNAEIEWDATSGPAPQKLPVRRVGNSEKDDDQSLQCSTFVEANTVNLPNADWDVSDGGLKDGTTLDFADFNFEDTEYEPQTYFSYTELLETDELEKLQGVDAPGTLDNWPCENSSSGLFDQSPAIDNNMPMQPATYVACCICSQTTPVPDLSCQNCGLKVHNQCSPWDKFSQGEGSWRCGNCQQWC